MRTRWLRGTAVLLALLGAVACSDSSDDEGADDASVATAGEVLVGEVDGGRGLVAVVHTADAVTVYSCGFDEALDTHTGWFNGVPEADGDDRVIPAITNVAGLTVEGRISGDEAEGTITLASGEEVAWQAHRASDNGAGLYAAEDALSLAGLIVAEDERMVGSAGIRFTPSSGTVGAGGTGTGLTTLPPRSTTTTRPGTTTTRPSITATPITTTRIVVPTRPARSTVAVTTTFPVAPDATRTVTLPPITRPRTVTRTGPAIVFLVHGMSENATTPGPNDPEVFPDCSGPRNSPVAGRCEWGPDFIPGLFGAGVGARLSNLAGQDVTGNRFLDTPANRLPFDETMGMPIAGGCAVDPTGEEDHDDLTAAHFVAPNVTPVQPGGPVPVPPQLSVFTTYRDSTSGIVASGQRLARQAYAAARWWEETYQLTPAIIFVAQSFGGLATRFVLGNPTDASVAPLDPDGIRLCPEDHARMDWLRDRTVYATTLATPHEGSFLSEVGEGGKDLLRQALTGLDSGVGSNELAAVVQAVGAVAPELAGGAEWTVAKARQVIAELLALLESPALRDMRLANMEAWNRGPLSPDRARRTGGSPIVGAAGQLIPLYAALGRTPGSSSFDTPILEEAFATYDAELPKEQGWIQMTSLASELLVTQFSPVGWGAIDGALAPHAEILDRRARIFDLSTDTAAAEAFVADAAEDVLGAGNRYFGGAFGGGADGVLAYLDSIQVHTFFPTALIPLYLDRVWRIDLSGSVEVPMLAFVCGGTELVLDHEPLVDALLLALGTTVAVADTIGDGDLRATMGVLGVALDEGGELAAGTIDWLFEEANAASAAGEGCSLPIDAADFFADPLSVGNLANWRMRRVAGTVPAPAWVRAEEIAHDGEQDTDGAVHAASALGLQLGREPFFFEHDRGGSWYRIPTEPITEQYNHGLQYQNDVGRWVSDRFFAAQVGPVPQAAGDSAWPA